MTLSGNNISEILPGTLQAQKNLTFLDLGNNSLHSVDGQEWEGLESLTTLRISGNSLRNVSSEAFSSLPKLETIIIDLKTLIALKQTILNTSTNPDPKSLPKFALEENYLKCDETNCWLKKLEEKGMFAHYMKDGRPSRPKCYNTSKLWDEVDLNCTGKFSCSWCSCDTQLSVIVLHKFFILFVFLHYISAPVGAEASVKRIIISVCLILLKLYARLSLSH